MEKPQNIIINRGSTTTGPVSATLADLVTSGEERLHSSVRMNDGETSKYNNQQGI